ncbi:hypothetical protein D3C80_1451300 [compost metagenome]
MTVAIPGQGAHPVARFDAQAGQSVGRLPGTLMSVGIGVAVQGATREAGNDFSIAVIPLRMLQQ